MNLARFSWENSGGEIFVQPDDATVTFEEAHLTLVKGITAVVTGPSGNRTFPGTGADNVTGVAGGDAVTYAAHRAERRWP